MCKLRPSGILLGHGQGARELRVTPRQRALADALDLVPAQVSKLLEATLIRSLGHIIRKKLRQVATHGLAIG